MRSIIEGKLYDTETATLVAQFYTKRLNMLNDLRGLNGSLYIKNNGEWFLCSNTEACRYLAMRQGTAMFHFRRGEWKDEEAILLLEPEDVKKWLSAHNFVDEYIKYFGKPEE